METTAVFVGSKGVEYLHASVPQHVIDGSIDGFVACLLIFVRLFQGCIKISV